MIRVITYITVTLLICVTSSLILKEDKVEYNPTAFNLEVEDDLFIITDHGKPVGIVERNGSIDSLLIDYLQ